MSEKIKKLVLFDIDGTLINSGGAGSRSLTRAFFEKFSIPNAFADITMAGKTDLMIIKEGLSAFEIPNNDGVISSIISTYLNILKTEIKNNQKHILPGVLECLNDLEKEKGFYTGLLTGNIRQGAGIKLEAFALNRFFSIGAFGDDNEDRNMLLPFAVKRFKNITKKDIPYNQCIIIGDTPSDIRCSKPYGAMSVAVSTGTFDRESLIRAEADYVLNDLTELFPLLKSLIYHDS